MLDILTKPALPISDFAIIVNTNDNVAVVKNETHEGLTVRLPHEGGLITLNEAVPLGHRFATRDIPAGEYVRQYGQPIGTSLGIEKGEWIDHDNMADDVPVVRDLPENLHNPAPDYLRPKRWRHSWVSTGRTAGLARGIMS